jgi:hypothetical protein
MESEKKGRRSPLRLVRGGRLCETRVGKLRIVAAPKDSPPFPVDAFVFEEDTFLVVSADPAPRDPKVPMVRIMTRLIETQPRVPGTVLLQGQSPLRLLAIIHDFNQEPSWREEWIEAALGNVFQQVQRLGVRSLSLPLLGTVYGSLDKRRFIELFVRALHRAAPGRLRSLWLMVPEGEAREAIKTLKTQIERENPDLFSPASC